MKKKMGALALILFLTKGAFAQIEFNEEEIVFLKDVSIPTLRCVIPAHASGSVEDRIFTELKDYDRALNGIDEIEMTHSRLTQGGCDIDQLDQMVEDSLQSFGFVQATITVKKGLAKEPRIVFGKCQRNYKEKVVVDFGNGVTLESSDLGKLIPAVGCH